MNYKIITDTSSDLSPELIQKYNICSLPLEVRFGDDIYSEGIDADTFYKKMATFEGLPKTSQITSPFFEDALKPFVNNADIHVFLLPLSSELSGTFSQAKLAVENLNAKNVTVFDTKQVTFALGALVIETAKLLNTNPKLEDAISKVKNLVRKTKLIAVIGDLKYLRLGGRLSSTGAFLGNMLSIKPVIHLEDGKVVPIYKAIGMIKANVYMVEKVKSRDNKFPMYFGHSNCKTLLEDFMARNKTMLELNGDEVITDIGSVVGTHAGPGCYGIVYFEN